MQTEVREMIRKAGICLVCGQWGGQHLLLCPLHDETTCTVCGEPQQFSLDLEVG